jgi:predicted small metal-binding protein
MKDFHCRDAGLDCDFVARGNDSKEILDQVGKHAQSAHKMQVTPELSKKVEGLIHEESSDAHKQSSQHKH